MAEDGTPVGSSSAPVTDKAPDWCPDRINPNLQRYWDGQAWSAQRRWVAGQWVEDQIGASPPPPGAAPGAPVGPAPNFPPSGPSVAMGPPSFAPPNQYMAAGSYGARPYATMTPPVTGLPGSLVGVLVCSVMLIIGSLTPWITVTLAGHSVGSANGIDTSISDLISINGWLVFAGGAVLFVLVILTAMTRERSIRGVSLVIALAAGGVAIYEAVRVIQKISSFHPSSSLGLPTTPLVSVSADVGWGLIITIVGAVGAILTAILDVRQG